MRYIILLCCSCVLTVTSPPLKEVRELAQRSMCKGGMLYTNDTGIPKKT